MYIIVTFNYKNVIHVIHVIIIICELYYIYIHADCGEMHAVYNYTEH